MSQVLRVVAGELEALTRSREYLAHLIRCGETRPAYQPEHSELACDRQLLGRLDKCQIRLGSEQTYLEERRTVLLREARANSPFACSLDLLERITNFETLQAHANNRSVKGLRSFSKQCQEGRLLIEGSRNFHKPKTSCLIFQTERCLLRALAWCICTVTPMAAKSHRLLR